MSLIGRLNSLTSLGEFPISVIKKVMQFQKVQDSSCPQIYGKWEPDEESWVIQNLLPEADEVALILMMEHLLPDKIIFTHSGSCQDFILIMVGTGKFTHMGVL